MNVSINAKLIPDIILFAYLYLFYILYGIMLP